MILKMCYYFQATTVGRTTTRSTTTQSTNTKSTTTQPTSTLLTRSETRKHSNEKDPEENDKNKEENSNITPESSLSTLMFKNTFSQSLSTTTKNGMFRTSYCN